MNKKSTVIKLLASMMLCTVGFFSYAQPILFESFEDTTVFPPNGWTTIDANGVADDDWTFTPGASQGYVGATDGVGTAISFSYSWVDGSPLTPDNYLITPQLSITEAGTKLSFDGRGTWGEPNGEVGDYLEVLVSTTGNAQGDFVDVLLSRNFETETWEHEDLNLDAYLGQNIYIAFRHYNSMNQEVIALDKIIVSSPFVDMTPMWVENLSPYTAAPAFQGARDLDLKLKVKNAGTAAVASFNVLTSVFKAPDMTTPIQTFTTAGASNNPGDTVDVVVGTYSVSTVGDYIVIHVVSAANDIQASNDTIGNGFSLTDHEFSRDYGDFAYLSGFPSLTGSRGNTFVLNSSASLDSIMWVYAPNTLGVHVRGEITMLNGTDNDTVAIGKTADFIADQALLDYVAVAGGAVMYAPVTDMNGNPLVLAPGRYFIGLHKADTTASMRLFHSTGIATIDGSLTRVTGSLFSDLLDSPTLAGGVPVVRGFFSASSSSISENASSAHLEVFPNPSSDVFTVVADQLNTYETIELQDQLGRVVGKWNINSVVMNLDVNNLASGNYLMVVRGAKGELVQQVQVRN